MQKAAEKSAQPAPAATPIDFNPMGPHLIAKWRNLGTPLNAGGLRCHLIGKRAGSNCRTQDMVGEGFVQRNTKAGWCAGKDDTSVYVCRLSSVAFVAAAWGQKPRHSLSTP